jgi:hypothetical protein
VLKISCIDNARQRRLVVEGNLIAPWAAELTRASLRGRELVIEMKQLTAIDLEGENVIIELIKSRIGFRCSGMFTKHVVKELTRRARRNQRIGAGD